MGRRLPGTRERHGDAAGAANPSATPEPSLGRQRLRKTRAAARLNTNKPDGTELRRCCNAGTRRRARGRTRNRENSGAVEKHARGARENLALARTGPGRRVCR
jgi:hypothetical protein